jgi:toxin ParE1/3/4
LATYELIYTPDAIVDLEEIFQFIAADDPRRARSYIKEIEKACRSLCETPLIGRERPNLRSGVRIFPLWRRVVIAYRLSAKQIDILRIFSGGRDYEAILGRL